ncbi:MAG: serine/threonine-protein phosphatase [Candidatus Eisenbacteria bacterium]|uniref:Serine/threonine-protein phosphatase n=1 Tax=Eiseniibacteriota bacterium TaxID=2212470 RepID=A0A849SMP3_UNCEI|nr:serine/threonine-protein phosphatase [Candidatus Eisenbacteria bacterium]
MPTGRGWPSSNAEQRRFFQSLPESAKLQLTLAVFCTFCVIGVMNDVWAVTTMRPMKLMVVITVGSGLMSAIALQSLMRDRRWTFVAAAFPLLFFLAARMFGETVGPVPPTLAAIKQRLFIDGMTCLTTTVAGYALFIGFITRAGRQQLRLRTEVELAGAIHDALVPAIGARLGHFDVHGRAQPSSEVGGDLFDAFASGDATIACIADVSGHGVHAGTLMAMVRSAVRTRLRGPAPLPEVLRDLNLLLLELEQRERFVTLALLRFDGEGVEVANAGHPPILRLRTGAARCETFESTAPPAGVTADPRFDSQRVTAGRGDLFVLYSDGISEVSDRTGREFGVAGIERIVVANAARSLAEIHDAVLSAARAHGPQTDDQTLLLVRRVT